MSDKDLIERLWREAYYVKPLSKGAYEALTDAADALEAATRERAAVPDAATERARQAEAELRDMLRVDIPSLKAERDAALEAIERVSVPMFDPGAKGLLHKCECGKVWAQ